MHWRELGGMRTGIIEMVISEWAYVGNDNECYGRGGYGRDTEECTKIIRRLKEVRRTTQDSTVELIIHHLHFPGHKSV